MKEKDSYPQLHNPSKKERLLLPTPEQKNAAEVVFYIKRINIFKEGSKSYVIWKKQNPRLGVKESRKSLKKRANTAFEELYGIDENIDGIQGFRERWREDAEIFENIFKRLKPKVISSEEQIVGNATSLSLKDRILISLKAGSAWRKLSSDQKDHLLTIAGYSRKELSDISKKIGISAGLTVGLGYSYEALGVAAGLKGAVNPFLGDFSESNAKIAIALSYLAYYSALGVNAQQNLRLLRNESINISPDIVATGTFFLLNKLLPRNERLQNWGTRLGSLSLDFIKEAGWAATMFIPEVGPSILVSANIAGAGLNTLQAIIAEGLLRYYKPKRKNN